MALYRSPLTVTLWPSSFLKKYGPMIPPAHESAPNRAHLQHNFSMSCIAYEEVCRQVPRRTASDVIQSGRPIFDDFSNICGRISAITRRMLSSKWSNVCGLSA
ncbi:hypothetical protein TNCV_3010151 [Trichonephila clavipes]|nr:hypothetical protein TNCV_3010151 [Trichonephila clavipes]